VEGMAGVYGVDPIVEVVRGGELEIT